MSRSRAWSFTINNYTFDDLHDMILNAGRFICFGFEKGKKCVEHIQGYVYYDDARTMTSIKKDMPRAHLEVSKGNAIQNVVYTSKEGEFYAFGDMPNQGKLAWEDIEEIMKDPRSNPHLYNQYRKMYRELMNSKPKDHKRRLFLIKFENRYKYAHSYNDCCLLNLLNYDSEECMILDPLTDFEIEDWINGFPPKIKRGYEIICVDPQIIFLYYKTINEYNYVLKKYVDYVEIDGDEKAI